MKVDWFSRGRDAMTEGRPCHINDARISNASRQDWYSGWNHQARLNNAKHITPEARAEAIAGLQDILDTLKTS
jgi:hypothetical protein